MGLLNFIWGAQDKIAGAKGKVTSVPSRIKDKVTPDPRKICHKVTGHKPGRGKGWVECKRCGTSVWV